MRIYASDNFRALTGRDETFLSGRDGTLLVARDVTTSWRRALPGISATPFMERAPQDASAWLRHTDVVAVPPTPFMDRKGN